MKILANKEIKNLFLSLSLVLGVTFLLAEIFLWLASGVPLYEQLYESLAAEMRSGAIPAGTRMPGKRRLAAELSVSVNTVDAVQTLAWKRQSRPASTQCRRT